MKIGIISNVFPGRDGIVRAVEVRTNNGTIQRPVQYLYPLELSCDYTKNIVEKTTLKVEAN